MCEHSKRAAQEANEIHKVITGPAARLQSHPVVVCQLQELVNLLVQVSVNLLLSSVAGVLSNETTLYGMEGRQHKVLHKEQDARLTKTSALTAQGNVSVGYHRVAISSG